MLAWSPRPPRRTGRSGGPTLALDLVRVLIDGLEQPLRLLGAQRTRLRLLFGVLRLGFFGLVPRVLRGRILGLILWFLIRRRLLSLLVVLFRRLLVLLILGILLILILVVRVLRVVSVRRKPKLPKLRAACRSLSSDLINSLPPA